MPLSRNNLRKIQGMQTGDFRNFLKRYGRNMEEGAFRKGFAAGAKAGTGADFEIILKSALTEVKGYGPTMHKRMMEHTERKLQQIREE